MPLGWLYSRNHELDSAKMFASCPTPSRFWQAALLLVAVACLTPNRASAGCGDYVTILDGTGNVSQHSSSGTNHQPDFPKPPCDGPQCSGSPTPTAPPLAPVAPVGSQSKELTQLLGTVSVSDTEPSFIYRYESHTSRPIDRATSIFHPPREG